MGLAMRRHMRSPLDPDPEATVRYYMQHREEHFLGLARKVISRPAHPYAQLFDVAGCTYADLENGVRNNGLEKTLESLLDEGVYVTQDEFRGRKEIVRSGRHIRATANSWDNDADEGFLEASSSGTGGRPIITKLSSAQLALAETGVLLLVRELNLTDCARVNIGPILPGFGVVALLIANRLKLGLDRWYAIGGATRANLHYRIATRFVVAQMRLFGAQAPYPIYLDQNNFLPVAEYMSRRRAEGVTTTLSGFVSSVTRVAAVAVDHRLDLSGCRAIVLGEALTDAKRRVIESAGIDAYPTYGTSDFGNIGYPCRHMNKGNCVHISRYAVGLVARRRDISSGEDGLSSLHATSLLPFTSRIFINVELGDTGIIEKTSCDCAYSRLGLDHQVRNIAAISKVTAQGMTIAADELVHLLEETLPSQFGGGAGDYQLIEREASSQTEVVLRIRPGVTAASPAQVLRYFLAETRRVYGGSLSVVSWIHSNGIRAELEPPILAATGKFRAIRLLGSGIATHTVARESEEKTA